MENDAPKTASASFEKVFFSVSEAAEFLTISKSKMRGYVREGQVAYSKLGRRTIFEKGDLVDLARKRKIQPEEMQRPPQLTFHQLIRSKR